MTNEQIKQNAEQYALKKTLISTDSFHGMAESYLEGAHSRDEEIEELEQALAFTEDVVDAQKKELDKLRNPWISVEDRLPEDCLPKIVLTDIGEICNMYYSEDDKKWFGNTIYGNVTNWMPIPQIVKGE